jgi:hypothetical protein
MGPRNAYKDMLENVVSPITCVSMNHQNQLEQMANWAMFATLCNIQLIFNVFGSTFDMLPLERKYLNGILLLSTIINSG